MPTSTTRKKATKGRPAARRTTSGRVVLAHWNDSECAERSRLLERAGFRVDTLTTEATSLKPLRERPPDAIVIDFTRLPSHGRALAMSLRQTKGTRAIPLVIVGGDPEKLDRVRHDIPDAVYCGWDDIRASVRRAIASPPENPVVPVSASGAYSGTPLPKKLGIKEHAVVALLGAPRSFEGLLAPIPPGVTLRTDLRKPADLIVWFVASTRDLKARLASVRASIGRDGLWIAWPKKSSGVASDLTDCVVRDAALPTGIVDIKVCAIDATWSGLKFTLRRS